MTPSPAALRERLPALTPLDQRRLGRRIDRAAALLRSRRAPSLDEVARATGHASASHLVRRFKARWGMTPGQYRAAASSVSR